MKKKEHVALTKCFFCGEARTILLATRYNHSGEPLTDLAPANGKVVDMTPCSKCEGYMKQGVILITIDPVKSDANWNKSTGEKNWIPNPYRTGGFFVLKDAAVKRMFDEVGEWAIKHRWMFMEHAVAEKLGMFEQKAL